MWRVTIGSCLPTKCQVDCGFTLLIFKTCNRKIILYCKTTFLLHLPKNKSCLCFDTTRISQVSTVLSIATRFLLLLEHQRSYTILGISVYFENIGENYTIWVALRLILFAI